MSRRGGWGAGLALVAALAAANPTWAAKAARAVAPPAFQEAAEAYEQGRLLAGEARLRALEQAGQSVDAVLGGDVDDARRAAARFLAGRIQADLGNRERAAELFEGAVRNKDPFEDDAVFAGIEMLEAQGRDLDAMKEWARWEKRFPASPLLPAARLAQAWNELRRGEAEAARRRLQALATSHAWLGKDNRFVLARAVAAYALGNYDEALATLGPKPGGAPAGYLRALCLDAKGVLLQAAAAYQEVAERHADSPLRDHALLAKANTFLAARDYRSAGNDFARVATRVIDPGVRAEAELRAAGAIFLAGRSDSALALLRGVVERHTGTDVGARAQFLIGEAVTAQGRPADAIVEFNRVLSQYFQHAVAASAQYRVARALDALGRRADATGSYQAVVAGYPLEPEAPAAAYLAGVGLMDQGKPLAATPYFQLVLDRYAGRKDAEGHVVFARPEHQELVEAALCLLQLCYHRAGNLGQLSGAPHLLLQQMPPSRSPWRAYALLVDADASAAQGRHPEAQATLEGLVRDFPDHAVGAAATKLLAWTYARQGRDSLAIVTEERLLAKYGMSADPGIVSGALLDIAHVRFNQKRYRDAAAAYEDFLQRFPTHAGRMLARYQAGLCYLRLDRAGDAVDRWERVVRDSAAHPLAERAWARAGDVYFQAERYDEARRCYTGLLEHFATSSAASLARLRLAQCAYNAGEDARALEAFAAVLEHHAGTPAATEAGRGQERALYRLSQTATGAQTLEQLIEKYPGSAFAADARFQLGKRLYQAKQWAEAADQFREVVSQFPGYSAADHAQFLMADACAQAGRGEEALQAYEQFLAYFPASELTATVHFRIGLARFAAQDWMQAAVAFTRATEDSAGREVRAASMYNLALCHRQLGQSGETRTLLERYQTDYPADERAADIAYQLGDLDETAGDLEGAEAGYLTALSRRPTAKLAIEVNYRLGRLREQRQEVAGALRAYVAATEGTERGNTFRLSALARMAALYESRKETTRAVAAYRDIARNAQDPELVAAASDRVSQLEGRKR